MDDVDEIWRSNLTKLVNLELNELKENVNDFFLLTNATFVCLMQCGFACLEAGSIRSKNVTNIMMKNILDVFISCFAFWLIGYAVAYGDGNSFIGWTYWGGVNLPDEKFSHWFFQFVFAATAATLVSGSVAERCNFVAYLIYSALISGFIYPIVAHWVWAPSGWLANLGYSDFAGDGPVHLLGGVCAGVAATILGPRIGRFDGEEMPGHSIPLIAIGGMILITGFLAFNGGSLGTITSQDAGIITSKVIVNTVIAGSGGALFGLTGAKLGLVKPKAWNFTLTLNSAFAGMVSVCASANSLNFWTSFVMGLIGGIVYFGFRFLVLYFKIDDPLDATAIHFGGGTWGVLAGPIFKTEGIIYGPNKKNLMVFIYNLAGATTIFCWSLVTSIILFGLLQYYGILRVSKEEELIGLDISKHNEIAYPIIGSSVNNYNGNATVKVTRHNYNNEAFQVDHL